MIAGRVAAVRDRIARAATRSGRSAADVTLVAVSKTFPAEAVREAFDAGLRQFGENRVQEAEAKVAALARLKPEGLTWHLIGHLQANKARKAIALFDRIHSVDSVDLARRLDRIAAEAGRRLRVLVQVELGGEATKHGIPDSGLLDALEAMRGLAGLQIEGLMTLPPYAEDPERVRPAFRRLRERLGQSRDRGLVEGAELSMGMSHDLEVAVEEGATLVRVGTAIFGPR